MQIFKNLVCQKYKMQDKFILVFKPKKTITQQIHSHTRISFHTFAQIPSSAFPSKNSESTLCFLPWTMFVKIGLYSPPTNVCRAYKDPSKKPQIHALKRHRSQLLNSKQRVMNWQVWVVLWWQSPRTLNMRRRRASNPCRDSFFPS